MNFGLSRMRYKWLTILRFTQIGIVNTEVGCAGFLQMLTVILIMCGEVEKKREPTLPWLNHYSKYSCRFGHVDGADRALHFQADAPVKNLSHTVTDIDEFKHIRRECDTLAVIGRSDKAAAA